MEPTATKPANNLAVPVVNCHRRSDVAGALYFTKGTTAPKENTANNEPTIADVAPVTPNDHILGNPNAPIVIVEYSDMECPFCKHSTVQ